MSVQLMQGDCLEIMKEIRDKSVDMILCDLPFGTTCNVWDKKLDLNKLFQQYERIVKSGGGNCLVFADAVQCGFGECKQKAFSL